MIQVAAMIMFGDWPMKATIWCGGTIWGQNGEGEQSLTQMWLSSSWSRRAGLCFAGGSKKGMN